jgi:hypothetical protein
MTDNTDSTETPRPVERTLCSICDLRWDQHERTARARLRDSVESGEYEGAVQFNAGGVARSWLESTATVTTLDCVLALQSNLRGPQGYPGTQGAMGTRGEPGPCSHAER